MTINLKMEDYEVLNLLLERVEFWTQDNDILKLYENYYQDLIDGGCFDGATISINEIVDNDYINWLDVCTKEEWTNYNIESEQDDSIMATFKDLYLVNCCY